MAAWRDRLKASPAFQRVRRWIGQRRGTEPRSRVQIRCERAAHGGWHVCPEAIREGDIVYSVGFGQDLEFERAMAGEYGARVFAFDPSPRSVEWIAEQSLPQNVRFNAVGVAGFDGTATFWEREEDGASPSILRMERETGEAFGARVLRLPSLMRSAGHRRLDMIKLDVEGAEYDVIRDLLRMELDVRQLLLEFHHRFEGVGIERTQEALELLDANGYRIFYISPDGREYSFIRTDFVAR